MLTFTSQPSLIVTPVRSQSVNRAPRRSAASNRAPRNSALPPPSPAWNRCGPNCGSAGSSGRAPAGPAGSLAAVMARMVALIPDGLLPGMWTPLHHCVRPRGLPEPLRAELGGPFQHVEVSLNLVPGISAITTPAPGRATVLFADLVRL